MKNFTKLNFELIDANLNLTPDMFITETGITFSKRVLEDLNYPSFVQYCINPEQKVFAVRFCKSNESKAVPFSKSKAEQRQTMNTRNKNIAEPIKAFIASYNPQLRYCVKGHFDAESRTVYYDLEEAVVKPFRAPKGE